MSHAFPPDPGHGHDQLHDPSPDDLDADADLDVDVTLEDEDVEILAAEEGDGGDQPGIADEEKPSGDKRQPA
jgi:hypothetical protein